MQLSDRAMNIQASPIRKLMPFANKAKKDGVHIYHLNIGQPDIHTAPEMMSVFRNFDEVILTYGPSDGLPEYKTSLVEYYKMNNIAVKEKDIIVTTAGSEAIIFALMAVCNEGDEVIVPEPFYANYNGFATMAGVTIVPLTTHAEDGFELPSSEKIKELITERTRAIIICNPGNPTGAVYTEEQLLRLEKIAKDYSLYIISDEVYREYVYDGMKHKSVLTLSDFDDHAIMIDSISKRYSACGARIGCIVSRNEKLMSCVMRFAQTRLCPPTLEQLAANAAANLGEEYFKEIHAEWDKRRNIVFNELDKNEDIICVKPKGAFYVIAKLPIKDSDHFAQWLLEEYRHENETVMVAPCAGFYATPGLGKDEIRIAYALNEHDLRKGMHIFTSALAEYRKHFE